MYDNYLLIVEGKKTEPNIFEKVLAKYGFNVIKSETPITVDDEFHFEKTEMKKNEKNVEIVYGIYGVSFPGGRSGSSGITRRGSGSDNCGNCSGKAENEQKVQKGDG